MFNFDFKSFLKDESGAITVDMVVVLGGSMLMAQTVVTDVSRGVTNVSEKLNVHFETVGDDYLAAPGQIYKERGNPGNYRGVGNSGENPNAGNNGNGQQGWGNGQHGASE